MSWCIIIRLTLVSVHITLYVLVYYFQAYIGINPYHTLCRGSLLSDVHWYQSISHAMSFIIVISTLVSVYIPLYVVVYYYQACIGISPYHILCQAYIGISLYHTLCLGILLSGFHWCQSTSHSMSWFIIVRRTLLSVHIKLYVMVYYYRAYIGISPYHTLCLGIFFQASIGISPYHTLCLGILLSGFHWYQSISHSMTGVYWYQSISHSMSWYIIISGFHWYQSISHSMYWYIFIRLTLVSVHITLYVLVYYYQAFICISPYHTLCRGLLLLDVHWYQSISHSMSWFIFVRRTLVSVHITHYVVVYYYQAYIGISPYHTLCLGILLSVFHWHQSMSHSTSWFNIIRRTLVSVHITLYVMVYYYQAYIGISAYHTPCHGLLLSGLHWYQSISHSMSRFIIIRNTSVSVHITIYVVVYFCQTYIAISPYHTLCRGLLLSDVHWYQSISQSMSWYIIISLSLASVHVTLYVVVYYCQTYIGISPYHTLCHGLLVSGLH